MTLRTPNKADVAMSVATGLTGALIEYTFPNSLDNSSERSAKRALKAGAKVAGASLLNDALSVSSYLPTSLDASYRQVIGDGICFSGIQAASSKEMRSGRRALMNLLYGTGISYVGNNITAQYVSPTVLGVLTPASPIQQTPTSPTTTSPGFSS